MKKVLTVVLMMVVLVMAMAATTLTTVVNLNFNCDYNKAGILNTSQDDMNLNCGLTLTSGTGANQANVLWKDTRTLADGANESLNLHDGSLKNGFGDSVAMTKLKILYIKNKSTDANCVVGAATNPVPLFGDAASDTLKIHPGGTAVIVAPDADGINVVTGVNLKILHDGSGTSTMTYDIIAVGVE